MGPPKIWFIREFGGRRRSWKEGNVFSIPKLYGNYAVQMRKPKKTDKIRPKSGIGDCPLAKILKLSSELPRSAMNERGQNQATALCSAASQSARTCSWGEGSSKSLFGVEGALCFGRTLFGGNFLWGKQLSLGRNIVCEETSFLCGRLHFEGSWKHFAGSFEPSNLWNSCLTVKIPL